MEQKINIPKVTSEFEKFDIVNYDRNKNNDEVRVVTEEAIAISMDYSNGYSQAVYPLDSYFNITKNYFKNGNIEVKGISFNNGSEYGDWYEFNEVGELVKTINTDEGYDFDWKAIIAYCEKNEILLTRGYKEFAGFQTKIYKKELEGEKVWQITYQIAGDKLLKLTLDGKTGKEIERKELEFVNH